MPSITKEERAYREELLSQGLKPCGKCGEVQPVSEFYAKREAWDKLAAQCKSCVAKYTADNHERIIARYRRYHAENRESRNAYTRRWFKENPEYQRSWQRNNRTKCIEYGRKYRDSITTVCAVDGCEAIARQKSDGSLCAMHARRVRKHGDPHYVRVAPRGQEHPSWQGNEITYGGAHTRVYTTRGHANEYPCVDCGEQAADWSYRGGAAVELTQVLPFKEGVWECAYSPDPADYDPRCKSCHTKYDQTRTRQEAVAA